MEEIIDRGEQKWRVVDVEALDDSRLKIAFFDGKIGILEAEMLDEIFEPVKRPGVFGQAKLAGDSIEWPGGMDIAPEYLYELINNR